MYLITIQIFSTCNDYLSNVYLNRKKGLYNFSDALKKSKMDTVIPHGNFLPPHVNI